MLYMVEWNDTQGLVTVTQDDREHQFTYAEARDLQRILNERWPTGQEPPTGARTNG